MRTLVILLFSVCLIGFSSCAPRVVYQPSTVTVVKTRPANYKIVRVRGKRYYFWNGNYYKKTGKGYVIVRL